MTYISLQHVLFICLFKRYLVPSHVVANAHFQTEQFAD
jgi:hypothetical protein